MTDDKKCGIFINQNFIPRHNALLALLDRYFALCPPKPLHLNLKNQKKGNLIFRSSSFANRLLSIFASILESLFLSRESSSFYNEITWNELIWKKLLI